MKSNELAAKIRQSAERPGNHTGLFLRAAKALDQAKRSPALARELRAWRGRDRERVGHFARAAATALERIR